MREKRDRSVPNLRPEIGKKYGMMEDGKKSYVEALEDLRQKVIKNFFTEQEAEMFTKQDK